MIIRRCSLQNQKNIYKNKKFLLYFNICKKRNPPGGKSSLFGGIAALGGGINQEESPYSNSKIEKKTNDRSAYLKELGINPYTLISFSFSF